MQKYVQYSFHSPLTLWDFLMPIVFSLFLDDNPDEEMSNFPGILDQTTTDLAVRKGRRA